jgi:small-conductance mechanosensitive channel
VSSWSSVLVISLLGLVLVVHLGLRWWFRRRTASGFWHLWPAVVLLLWIHGLYLAFGLLLPEPGETEYSGWWLTASRWVYGLAVVATIVWMSSRAGRVIESFLTSLASRADTAWDDVLLPLAGRAVRRALPLLALILAAPVLAISPALAEITRNGTSLFLIGLIAWILLQAVDAGASMVLKQYRLDVDDNLQARSIYTQVMVLKKVAASAIGLFALASMLMVFESVRQFGASILASAGVAGIIVGFAAQRSIATLLAGFQIALTQPIRVDDVVIVENEWGRIEEITLTYVVVHIWDQRRLVVPITYFIEKPFQNWTRTSSEMLATVFLHTDYTVSVGALREELTRILSRSTLWDRRVNVLQVTAAKEHTLEVRALASACDASRAWDLRCEIREHLILFVQQNYPASLPRLRVAFDSVAENRTGVQG